MTNPSARMATLAAAIKFTHPGAAAELRELVTLVRRLERTLDDITADALEDINAELARQIGFSSRHHEAMTLLRQAAERGGPVTIKPDWFDRPDYINRRKGESA